MAVRVLEIVAGTTDAAFATTAEGRIVTWNAAAVRLLGFRASRVVGRRCHDVLCGTDSSGRRVCGEACPWVRDPRQCEPVSDLEVVYRDAAGRATRTRVSVIVVPGDEPSELFVVHLLTPVKPEVATANRDTARKAVENRSELPTNAAAAAAGGRLTPREREVLGLMAGGTGTRAIGSQLAISPATVRNHIQRILRKLGVHSRRAAVATARRAGLV